MLWLVVSLVSQPFRQRKKLLVDVANLATCCYDDCDVTIGGLGTLRKCYVSSPVAKALVLDWKSWLAQVFLDVFLGLTLTGPKKASKSTFYIIDWIRKKTPGRCCQSGYLLLWWLWCTIGGLGTLRKCYVSSPVAKSFGFGIENHDWHNSFWMSFLGLTLTGPKKASKRTILHNRLNMEKTPGRCCQSVYLLPWWLWCTIGGFGNPARMLC